MNYNCIYWLGCFWFCDFTNSNWIKQDTPKTTSIILLYKPYWSNVDYCSLLTKHANWWFKGISSYFTKYSKNFCWQFQIGSVAINIDSLLLYSSLAITRSFFKFFSSRKSFLMPDLEKIFEKKGSCQNQKLMYLHRKKKNHCEIRGFRE